MKTTATLGHASGNVPVLNVPETDLDCVIRHAEAGDYEAALTILRKPTADPQLRNALGVCNLRMGRAQEAMRIYRDLVLVPGGGWNKPNTPVIYKTNFATALLMGDQPCGAKEMLEDVADDQHPSVVRLRKAMKAWEATLSLGQWINWKWFLLGPQNRPVTIEFTPGDFVDPTEQRAG